MTSNIAIHIFNYYVSFPIEIWVWEGGCFISCSYYCYSKLPKKKQLKGEKYLFYVTVGGPVVLMENRGDGSLRQLLALHPQSGTQERKAGSHLLPLRAAWDSSPWNGAHNQGRSFISVNMIWQHQSPAVVFTFAPSSFREFLKWKPEEWPKTNKKISCRDFLLTD